MNILRYSVLALGLYTVACTSEKGIEEEVVITEVNISLDSAKFQRAYDLIDRWQQDSLLPLLSHPDPSFRVLATQGFSGMMDEEFIDEVGRGISDPIVEVRRITAYTLGQSYSKEALPFLMQVFEQQDSLGIDPLSFKYALEAVGKCADSSYLPLLAGISTYTPGDTLLLEGQCLGILNMAEKGYSGDLATALMTRYVTGADYSSSVRLIAANYLARGVQLDLSDYQDSLMVAFETEQDPEIRMFLGKAIGKTGVSAGSWIRRAVRNEEDDRVRIALLQGIVGLPLNIRHRIWSSSLRDKNDLVSNTAADLILQYGSSAYSETYTNWAFSNYSPTVYARILAAGNKYITNPRFREMVQELIFQRIRTTTDPYMKSDFIMAAGQRLSTAQQLIRLDGEDEALMVRTAILEAIVEAISQAGTISSRGKDFLIDRWNSGDIAALSILSPFFVNQRTLFPDLTTDEELWSNISSGLPMPEGIEARIQVDKARAELFDFVYDPIFYRKPSMHTHPIDWGLYEQLPDRPRANIVTNHGTMTVLLLKKEAPGTVLNFVQLAESGYYEDKLIHRVVPNFVIQGGGNRGDGYGSLDYTIRSEVPPLYYDQSGLVGIASAGLHTESQQWFVTLRPTLHLNGRYTLFGRVLSGEDVLRNIRRGDVIQSIKITR